MAFEIIPAFQNIFVVCLGLVIGSFLNVVIVRLPQGKSVVKPRSQCGGCHTIISWYDNVPVISFLILGGKCRKCKAAISVRYPVIEIVTAFLFYGCFLRFGWDWLLVLRDWPFVSILVAITFIDLEHRIIPDVLSLGGLVLGLTTAYFVPDLGLFSSFIGAAVGFGLFYGLAWAYYWKTGKHGLGGGDVKLLAMLGAFLGLDGVLWTILASSVTGSFVGLIWGLAQKKKGSSEADGGLLGVAIPYGPFLVVGALSFYLLRELISQWFPFMTPM